MNTLVYISGCRKWQYQFVRFLHRSPRRRGTHKVTSKIHDLHNRPPNVKALLLHVLMIVCAWQWHLVCNLILLYSANLISRIRKVLAPKQMTFRWLKKSKQVTLVSIYLNLELLIHYQQIWLNYCGIMIIMFTWGYTIVLLLQTWYPLYRSLCFQNVLNSDVKPALIVWLQVSVCLMTETAKFYFMYLEWLVYM